MTTTPYGPPASGVAPAPAGTGVRVLKVVLAVALVAAALAAAALAAFAALVTSTGCFISCSDPQPGAGALLGLLAAALVVAGPLLARLMWRTTGSPRALAAWSALVLGPAVLALLAGTVSPLLAPA